MPSTFSELERTFGSETIAVMASAYEAALAALLDSPGRTTIPRETRLAIVEGILAIVHGGEHDGSVIRVRAINIAMTRRGRNG